MFIRSQNTKPVAGAVASFGGVISTTGTVTSPEEGDGVFSSWSTEPRIPNQITLVSCGYDVCL